MAMTGRCFRPWASFPSSSRESTAPVGLLGLLRMTALAFGVRRPRIFEAFKRNPSPGSRG
jgi:hypothetical protein